MKMYTKKQIADGYDLMMSGPRNPDATIQDLIDNYVAPVAYQHAQTHVEKTEQAPVNKANNSVILNSDGGFRIQK